MALWSLSSDKQKLQKQKQPSIGVLTKRYSENMQQIYMSAEVQIL